MIIKKFRKMGVKNYKFWGGDFFIAKLQKKDEIRVFRKNSSTEEKSRVA